MISCICYTIRTEPNIARSSDENRKWMNCAEKSKAEGRNERRKESLKIVLGFGSVHSRLGIGLSLFGRFRFIAEPNAKDFGMFLLGSMFAIKQSIPSCYSGGMLAE